MALQAHCHLTGELNKHFYNLSVDDPFNSLEICFANSDVMLSGVPSNTSVQQLGSRLLLEGLVNSYNMEDGECT